MGNISNASKDRYPKGILTKFNLIKYYHDKHDKNALWPQCPIDDSDKSVNWMKLRHFLLLIRVHFCLFCSELNLSVSIFGKAFLYCFGCSQAICALCTVSIYGNVYGKVDDIIRSSKHKRITRWLCPECQARSGRDGLSVCFCISMYMQKCLHICVHLYRYIGMLIMVKFRRESMSINHGKQNGGVKIFCHSYIRYKKRQ